MRQLGVKSFQFPLLERHCGVSGIVVASHCTRFQRTRRLARFLELNSVVVGGGKYPCISLLKIRNFPRAISCSSIIRGKIVKYPIWFHDIRRVQEYIYAGKEILFCGNLLKHSGDVPSHFLSSILLKVSRIYIILRSQIII